MQSNPIGKDGKDPPWQWKQLLFSIEKGASTLLNVTRVVSQLWYVS